MGESHHNEHDHDYEDDDDIDKNNNNWHYDSRSIIMVQMFNSRGRINNPFNYTSMSYWHLKLFSKANCVC